MSLKEAVDREKSGLSPKCDADGKLHHNRYSHDPKIAAKVLPDLFEQP